ncbi:hypothetical protein BDV23DRAFT_81578 [Aspergillus alliaceus]|uniref:Uncharacterized protein n=1 Tax=Petromyces alliaceus TaxID=209559 RepID=A0A5N7CNH7_PETAA|nr:hypothetical protein BDV23DRAFT_81578 [Aspergillus alliaceus]
MNNALKYYPVLLGEVIEDCYEIKAKLGYCVACLAPPRSTYIHDPRHWREQGRRARRNITASTPLKWDIQERSSSAGFWVVRYYTAIHSGLERTLMNSCNLCTELSSGRPRKGLQQRSS